MHAYILKRFLLFIPTLIMVTVLVFVLIRLIPGDPALLLLAGDSGEGTFTQAKLDELRAQLGTDRPIYVQYGDWVWDMLRLDFGMSAFYDTPISEDLGDKFLITLELTILAVLMATVMAVPLGVISAIKQDTLPDYISRVITFAGIAVPNFWLGILIVYFLVLVFGWLPPLGYVNLWEDVGKNLQQVIFPAIALAVFNMAFIARVTRSSMLEVFREDYIRTARGKGLGEPTVIYRHALKNALLPVVTVSGYEFGRLIAGTVVIESIFLVPGMGRLLIDGIFHRDYPVVQAVLVVITVVVLAVNVGLDLLYAWLNPRIRYT
jgi:peptide/nickel transport system permease protein